MTIIDSRRLLLATAALLLTLAGTGKAYAEDKPCAVVALHGKWGNPQQMALFGRKLEPHCVVKAIEMPFSGRRNYDAPYSAALDDIAAQVRAFRSTGYKRVILLGQSFGTNAALAYMADRGDKDVVDAVVAMAPGHAPAEFYARGLTRGPVDQARELVAQGKGGDMLSIDDVNQGQRRNIRMRADVLLSYFDPSGLGDMPRSVGAFKRPVALLWVVGMGDGMYKAGEGYAYNKAPPHPSSRYLVVEGDHMSTQDVAAPKILEWIRALE